MLRQAIGERNRSRLQVDRSQVLDRIAFQHKLARRHSCCLATVRSALSEMRWPPSFQTLISRATSKHFPHAILLCACQCAWPMQVLTSYCTTWAIPLTRGYKSDGIVMFAVHHGIHGPNRNGTTLTACYVARGALQYQQYQGGAATTNHTPGGCCARSTSTTIQKRTGNQLTVPSRTACHASKYECMLV